MQKLVKFAALLVFFYLFTDDVSAVEIQITNYPTQITADEFTVDTTVIYGSSSTNSNIFLRVDLYKDGTSNYFSETWNGSAWYGDSDGTNYFPLEIQNGSGSAQLKAKIQNPLPSAYEGPGQYKLRIRRYTASGNAASGDTQTPVDVQISLVIPTPVPTPTPTSQSTPTPTQTIVITPKPTSNPTPTPKTTPKPTPKQEVKLDTQATGSGLVLGIHSLTAQNKATPEASVAANNRKEKANTYPYFLIGSGFCFFLIAAPKLKDLFVSLAGTHFSG